MPRTKRQVLETLNFGHRIAEDEADALARYFVETDTWRQRDAGELDVIYGSKGAGKSALYALLTRENPERRARGVVVVPCEEVRGAPAFEQLRADPPTSEAEFRLLWLTYFLSLVGRVLLDEHLETPEARHVIRRLAEFGLIEEPFSVSGLFRRVAAVVRRVRVDPQLTFDETGATTVSAKPRVEERLPPVPTPSSLLELYGVADRGLLNAGLTVWLALDRLDVAFADEPGLETNALRSLFHTYRSLRGQSHIALKIFLRSDIWSSLTRQQFREASHITRERTLQWSLDGLLNLIARRAAENIPLLEYYDVNKSDLLESLERQRQFCDTMFEPSRSAEGTLGAFDWFTRALRDGAHRVSPRDVIHFLTSARTAQLVQFEMGGPVPRGGYMIGSGVYARALREVAVFRMQRSFFAEYPKLRPYVEVLEGAPSSLTLGDLQRRWSTDTTTSRETSDRLVELGILERVRTHNATVFNIPPLTQRGLASLNST